MIDNQRKDYKKPYTPTPQETPQPRSYLANLFQPPADPKEAEAERAALFGRYKKTPPTSSSSFTK